MKALSYAGFNIETDQIEKMYNEIQKSIDDIAHTLDNETIEKFFIWFDLKIFDTR